MAGIPKFDRGEVLLSAARQFADRGYEGASISHLVDATGLLRGSLYGAFGSKAELFRLAFGEAASTPERDSDLVIDLTVVALRERAVHDGVVCASARSVLLSLDATGVPASEQIYRRLLARAGVALEKTTDSLRSKEEDNG
ncbi:MAG: helix-turn-helix domain-containing protein [Arachnia sp.]